MSKLKVVYMTHPDKEGCVCVSLTDGRVTDLVRPRLTEKGFKYIVKSFASLEDMPDEEFAKYTYVEYLSFDDPDSPTDVVLDKVKAEYYYTQAIREDRVKVLKALDNLQLRYVVQGRSDIVAAIEQDKEILRDLPYTYSLGDIKSVWSLFERVPVQLIIDYEDKYKDLANAATT